MKQKKQFSVIYIITELELGGAQKICLSLYNELGTRHSINTHLITGGKGYLAPLIPSHDTILLLPELQRTVSLNAFFYEIITFFKIIHHLCKLKKKHDILIVHTHSTKAGILGRWAAWFARIPYRIHTIHGFAFHNHQSLCMWWLFYSIELITSFITTEYICVSSHDVKQSIKLFPRFAHKHTIIRAAVDKKFFMQKKSLQHYRFADNSLSGDSLFIFGTIACFKPQKNIIDLLCAFKNVYEYDTRARLEIIGDGDLRKMIENWIRDNNLSSVITLHGWQNNVLPFLHTWHTFVLSSLWEGLPCAIVEARLCGLPIISYKTGGITDIISHNCNGLIINQKDVSSFGHAMRSLMQDTLLYKRLCSHQDNLHDFRPDLMIEEHVSLYKKITFPHKIHEKQHQG